MHDPSITYIIWAAAITVLIMLPTLSISVGAFIVARRHIRAGGIASERLACMQDCLRVAALAFIAFLLSAATVCELLYHGLLSSK